MEQYVAPLVGAWIEIFLLRGETTDYIRSLPLWERGLKYSPAWFFHPPGCSRSPCGSVD